MKDNFVNIHPSIIQGEILAPPSKSVMIRLLAGALLAKGASKIVNPSYCNDSVTAINILKEFGCEIFPDSDLMKIDSSEMEINRPQALNCMESGLSLRLFSIISSLSNNRIIINAEDTLLKRKSNQFENILINLGVNLSTNNGYPPFIIQGPIKNGKISMDGSEGSQLLTGLLFTLPLLNGDSEIIVSNQKSKPYIDLSIKILKDFGINIYNDDYKYYHIKGNQTYKTGKYFVEGDWSGAAFFLVSGVIAGSIKINGLDFDSKQSDKRIIDALIASGSNMKILDNSIYISQSNLSGFEFDATDSPDLFPALVVLALNCKGKSIIYGTDRLKNKESDRASVLYEEFKKLGAKIMLKDNSMFIEECKLNGGDVNSHNDHRIAMALAIAGLNSNEQIKINNPECVSKSFQDFFKKLNNIMRIK
jgi:3-phosphoshikimate 1-carboxyvinyltransferase